MPARDTAPGIGVGESVDVGEGMVVVVGPGNVLVMVGEGIGLGVAVGENASIVAWTMASTSAWAPWGTKITFSGGVRARLVAIHQLFTRQARRLCSGGN